MRLFATRSDPNWADALIIGGMAVADRKTDTETDIMHDEHDVWHKTYFDRAIQTPIGAALRQNYDLAQPLPDRISTLLTQLEGQSEEPDNVEGQQAQRATAPSAKGGASKS
jgi:hypothetical protein